MKGVFSRTLARAPIVIGLPALWLAGCTASLPDPDPHKAWVDLKVERVADRLMAEKVDDKTWPDGRYFEVTPGDHALQVRYTYEPTQGPIDKLTNNGQRSCLITLHYASFAAGKRYLVYAKEVDVSPRVWLSDSAGNKLDEKYDSFCLP